MKKARSAKIVDCNGWKTVVSTHRNGVGVPSGRNPVPWWDIAP
jgi:hypothetical protein